MALQMQKLVSGSWVAVDIEASNISGVRLEVSDRHAAKLSFRMYKPEHTTPLPRLTFIKVWDDEGEDPTGTDWSSSNPFFEGYIETITPASGYTLQVVAFDATYRLNQSVNCMSVPWVAGTPPTRGTGAIPRVVYNVTVDADDDYALARASQSSVGTMVQELLDDQAEMLAEFRAGPSSGYAYDATEVDDMTCIPQQKITIETEGVRSAVARIMQQYEPRYRMTWRPGDRQWRFYKVNSSPEITHTLNDITSANVVLSKELDINLDGRYTAIRYYGPQATSVELFTTAATTLTGSNSVIIQQYTTGSGTFDATAYTLYQVTDSAKRRSARALPYPTPLFDGPLAQITYLYPIFQITFDDSNWVIPSPTTQLSATLSVSADTITFAAFRPRNGDRIIFANTASTTDPPVPQYSYYAVNSSGTSCKLALTPGGTAVGLTSSDGAIEATIVAPVVYDYQRGIVDLRTPRWQTRTAVAGSTQTLFPPTNARLLWAPLINGISLRVPSSGFEGTAYTVAGLENTLERYDEMLAVGREFGQPVTTADRISRFTVLAQSELDERKDIAYTGGMTLDGFDYRYAWLNKRVNLAAKDKDGATLTTGWEAMKAVVTDVEYDFDEMLTTLTFNSDLLSLGSRDVALMKEDLKIKAQEQIVTLTTEFTFRERRGEVKGNRYNELSGVTVRSNFSYRDAE
jgi:hypothetical protein